MKYLHNQWSDSVKIKQLQEFLKSDHWLRRYSILSGGVFYSEPPCIFALWMAVLHHFTVDRKTIIT